MDGALTLPEERPATRGAAPSLADARALVTSTLGEAARLASSEDAVEAAVGRLLAQHGTEQGAGAQAAAERVAARLEATGLEGAGLYQAAGAALDDGREAEALALLAALAATPSGRPDALLGLAVCAARLGCHEEGLVLALASQELLPDHPRPRRVAGLCELELGNRRAAQAHLAVAARLARRDPAFREDLGAAQRALLLMHLG